MTPHLGGYCFLVFLSGTPSSRSRTIEGLYELARFPSRAIIIALGYITPPQRNLYWKMITFSPE